MVVVRWLSALRPYRDVEELPTARKIQVITSRSLGGYGGCCVVRSRGMR